MKHTYVNVDFGSLDYGQALARYFFELKEALVFAGWTVKGSGDGSGRYSAEGVTAALPGAEQGSGGDFDCWQTDGIGSLDTAGGVWSSGAWVWVEEPAGGEGRQYVLQMSTSSPVVGGWGGYGNVAYNRAGDFEPASVGVGTAPSLGSGVNIWGSPNSTGASLWYGVTDLYRAHFWVHDDPVSGAYGFGGFVTRSNNTMRFAFGQLPLGPEAHVAGDGDPIAHLRSTGTLTVGRYSMYGTQDQSYLSGVSLSTGNSQFWAGNGPTVDARDGYDRVAPIPIYHGSAALEQLAGVAGDLRWSGSGRGYPDFCRDENGECWVYVANGYLLPWQDVASPDTPPTPE